MTISKKMIATVSIITALLTQAAFAQDKPATDIAAPTAQEEKIENLSFGINAEPIWALLSGFGLKFEYFVTDKTSVGIQGMSFNYKANDTSTTLTKYTLLHSEVFLGSNIMLTGTLSSRGLYIHPAIGYQTTEIKDYGTSNLNGTLNSPLAQFTVGYQWILAKHLRLAAGGGLNMYQQNDIIVKDSTGTEVYRDKSSTLGGLALDLHVGYVF